MPRPTPGRRGAGIAAGTTPGSIAVDGAGFRAERGALVANIGRILRATADRPPGFGCFGLHEWAMVYRQPQHRHPVPLRLGQDATDAVVEAHELRCTHFDAFRFFTPEAVPRNRETPTRERQAALEQPGCLHAGMDLYKWAVKLGPLVPGELLLDAFELARDIRMLDMRPRRTTSPTGATTPSPIETAEGKAEYVRAPAGVRRARPGDPGRGCSTCRRGLTQSARGAVGAGQVARRPPRRRRAAAPSRGSRPPPAGRRAGRRTRPRRRCRRRSASRCRVSSTPPSAPCRCPRRGRRRRWRRDPRTAATPEACSIPRSSVTVTPSKPSSSRAIRCHSGDSVAGAGSTAV